MINVEEVQICLQLSDSVAASSVARRRAKYKRRYTTPPSSLVFNFGYPITRPYFVVLGWAFNKGRISDDKYAGFSLSIETEVPTNRN